MVWAGQELEILAHVHVLLTLHSESQTCGLSAYVCTAVIQLLYPGYQE